MRKLYKKHEIKGEKCYVPTVHGKHVLLGFRKATDAQAHSEALLARYRRMKGLTNAPQTPAAS